MNRRILMGLTCALVYGLGVSRIVTAETIVVDDQVQVRDEGVNTPKRGITMSQVEAKFGAPSAKHDAVGVPPITRWDYPNFSVFFEHDRVIHAVVVAGEYAAGGGPLALADQVWSDLIQLEPSAWLLVLSPYVFVQLARLIRRTWRARPV